jgi:hypothetical protein
VTRAWGHNRGVSGIGSVAPRLVVVALLALGLVGMHHLVVVACHHAAAHSAHASTATPGGVLSMDTHAAHADHGSGLGAHAPTSPQPPADEPSGLAAVAATCLAILLMLVGLVLPQILARVRRWRVMQLRLHEPPTATRAFRPPDLTLLSVSRT